MDLLINPLKPNEISLYFQLGQSIPVLRIANWYFFLYIFIQFSIEHSVNKQWRTWSDAALCGVWSGTALFAYVPHKGR